MTEAEVRSKIQNIKADISRLNVRNDWDISTEVRNMELEWDTDSGREFVRKLKEDNAQLGEDLRSLSTLIDSLNKKSISVTTEATKNV